MAKKYFGIHFAFELHIRLALSEIKIYKDIITRIIKQVKSMKKVILAAVTLIFVVLTGTANAQTATDNVTVNIKLNPIHTIVVDGGQKTVDLEYSTTGDYLSGVSSPSLSKHLTIFSTGGFVVNVKTGGDFINTKVNTAVIEANTVSVSAVPADGNDLNVTDNPSVNLTSSDQTFLRSSNGGRNKEFNVTYKAKGADEYLKDKFSVNYLEDGATKAVYTATVTYTILAD